MTLYAVLEVSPDADQDTIRTAYRALVRRYHPDRGPESSADRFRQVVTAYETLGDPSRREAYDRSLQPPPLTSAIRAEPFVPVEPIVWAEPMVRTRVEYRPHPRRFSSDFDDLFDELLRAFHEDFFGPFWR